MKLYNKIVEDVNFYVQGLGFDSMPEFIESTIRVSAIKKTLLTSMSLGTIALFIEENLGISFMVYICFLLLIASEIWTGIGASKAKGIKIQSRKGGRMIIKMGIYTTIIGVLYRFSLELKSPEIPILNVDVNIWAWTYYVVLTQITFQLFLSVLENLSDMGYKETNTIVRVLYKAMNKWFELKQEEK